MGGSALLSSSLPFSAGCENHRYLQRGKKHNAKLPILSFLRSTLFCLLFRVFCSSLLQVEGLPAFSPLSLCISGGW
jgi:hypothetical protein